MRNAKDLWQWQQVQLDAGVSRILLQSKSSEKMIGQERKEGETQGRKGNKGNRSRSY